jgi:hypothetical protein
MSEQYQPLTIYFRSAVSANKAVLYSFALFVMILCRVSQMVTFLDVFQSGTFTRVALCVQPAISQPPVALFFVFVFVFVFFDPA